MAGHRSNNSILNSIWDDTDPIKALEEEWKIVDKPTGFTIQVTDPSGSAIKTTVTKEPAVEEKKTETKSVQEPPSLKESEAFSTLKLFHSMGLAGDADDIFEDIQTPKTNGANGGGIFPMSGRMTDVMQKQSFIMESKLNQMGNGTLPSLSEDEANIVGNGMNGHAIVKGIVGNYDPYSVADDSFVPQTDIFETGNIPKPIKGGKGVDPEQNGGDNAPKPIKGGTKSTRKVQILNDDDGLFEDDIPAPMEYQEIKPRKENDVKDMADYKEITKADLQQFESMIKNTESMIDEMIDICNYRGYGLNSEHAIDEEIAIKEEALNSNIFRYSQYASEQLHQFNFNLSSNAIVDLMGVKHTMYFRMNSDAQSEYSSDCNISSQGYVLYENKRLTPHYYFTMLDHRTRRRIDIMIAKIVRDYLRMGHYKMREFEYPTKESLKGITPILTRHFLKTCKILYKLPYRLEEIEKERENHRVKGVPMDIDMGIYENYFLQQQQQSLSADDNYCVIVFPNHKPHLKHGFWSRSVTYFDNAIRGTMFQFIDDCTSMQKGNGWGLVLMNPNERHTESAHWHTKFKYDDPMSAKGTETITVPRNEASAAHTIEMWKHFIYPKVVKEWKCKLLLIAHCSGGNDIVHLLENEPNSHEHIIGIAMLDFYNWALSEFSKKTRKIIEQKAAMFFSMYGSNETAYGLEPSASKSPVTIFRTANKEKRYSPCFNQESVIRFFKSKIELHKQK